MTNVPSPSACALLACTECGGALDPAWVCSICRRAYPTALGIPLLFSDPKQVLAGWSERLAVFVAESEASARELLKDSVDPDLLDRSRRRLLDTARGIEGRKQQVLELFKSAGIGPSPGEVGSRVESILSYVALVHRDFGWAEDESEAQASLASIRAIVDSELRLGTTLVLGAGTGRLGWDLALAFQEEGPVVLLDINPLPFLIGESLRRGESLRLFEIPGHPRRSDQAIVDRRLSAPGPAPRGLTYVFGDGLDPPFQKGSFDTILTPWFMDQVPSDMAPLLSRVHELLRPSGTYIQYGPFVYDPKRTRPAHRYTADEFVQLLLRVGFVIQGASYVPTSYLRSPVSTQARSEFVLTLSAKKGEAATPSGNTGWLADEDLPVPVFSLPPGFRPPHPVVEAVLELVDGARSTCSIAERLVRDEKLADDGTAIAAVRGCLKVLWKARRPE